MPVMEAVRGGRSGGCWSGSSGSAPKNSGSNAQQSVLSLLRLAVAEASRGAGQQEWGQHTTVLRGLRLLASPINGGSAVNGRKTYL